MTKYSPSPDELVERWDYLSADPFEKGEQCIQRMKRLYFKASEKWGEKEVITHCYFCIPSHCVLALAWVFSSLQRKIFRDMEFADAIDGGEMPFMGLRVQVDKVWAVAHD